MGTGLGCGMAAMDNVVSCLGFFRIYTSEWLFLFCTILAVSATGLVCTGFLCRFAPLCESTLTSPCCLAVSAGVYMWRIFSWCVAGVLWLLCLLQVYSVCVNIHYMFSCPVFVWQGTISTMSVYLVCKLTFHTFA
jgi:hypothetical protein